jgi:hypothetical protein
MERTPRRAPASWRPGCPGWRERGPEDQGVVVREFWARRARSSPRASTPSGPAAGPARGGQPLRLAALRDVPGHPVPGRFWPTCFTEQAISPQTELNKTLSQIAENAAASATLPSRSPGRPTSNGTASPARRSSSMTRWPTPSRSSSRSPRCRATCRTACRRSSRAIRTRRPARGLPGQRPTGVTAAAAINLLQEADDTRLGPDIEDMEKTLEDAGKRILQLIARYYTDERTMASSPGRTGPGTSVAGRADAQRQHDVQVQAGSGMPRSKAAKQAAMQETLNLFLQYGLQIDQRSLRKFFKDFEVGGLETLCPTRWTRTSPRSSASISAFGRRDAPAERLGQPRVPRRGHNDFRKGARYARLARDPAERQRTSGNRPDQYTMARDKPAPTAAQARAQARTPSTGTSSWRPARRARGPLRHTYVDATAFKENGDPEIVTVRERGGGLRNFSVRYDDLAPAESRGNGGR